LPPADVFEPENAPLETENGIASSKDKAAIMEQLRPAIEALLNHNHGGDWHVTIADELTEEAMKSGWTVCEMKSKFLIAENQAVPQAA
jgi:hypothetical protein